MIENTDDIEAGLRGPSLIESLPSELLLNIFKFTPKDILAITLTCKCFYQICKVHHTSLMPNLLIALLPKIQNWDPFAESKDAVNLLDYPIDRSAKAAACEKTNTIFCQMSRGSNARRNDSLLLVKQSPQRSEKLVHEYFKLRQQQSDLIDMNARYNRDLDTGYYEKTMSLALFITVAVIFLAPDSIPLLLKMLAAIAPPAFVSTKAFRQDSYHVNDQTCYQIAEFKKSVTGDLKIKVV